MSSAFALVALLGGCKQAPELPSVLAPYRIDIQQGNVITQDMLSKLKAGMTRSQVRFVLGSPLVVDPFRGDRWDYVSSFQKQGKEVERRRITVIFEDDKLVRIEGDVTVSDAVVSPDKPATKPAAIESVKPAPVTPPAATTAAPTKVDSTSPVNSKPDAAGSEPPKAAAAIVPEDKKAEPAKKEAPAEKPKQPGFFSRMLDKLGI